MRLVRARELKPGDKLFFTLERVVRTFIDKLTKDGYINVVLAKETSVQYRTRCAAYKVHRRIRLL